MIKFKVGIVRVIIIIVIMILGCYCSDFAESGGGSAPSAGASESSDSKLEPSECPAQAEIALLSLRLA